MDSERWEQIEALFFGALDRDPQERMVFLHAACVDDPALRGEVEAMLDAHEHSQGLLLESRLLAGEPVALPGPDDLVGTHVGSYHVKRLLGQGGMGAVYLAERDDGQYRQAVALKLIRPGLHTAEVVSRFRVERQILARLVHPHIAQLLDGGMTEDGFPYLVMEYVEGVPLTHYCDAHHLPIRQRLQLFQTVCQAVQFAHRNLVVHRDLKPTNILVTGEGHVKLLDFGVAKLLDPAAVGVSVAQTRAEVRLMTPEYAAPEQVRGAAITTGTDIYALGALLYELLTGHRPYRLPERWQAEVERIICEEEPTRPSTVVAEVEHVAQADGTTVALTPERVSAARNTLAGRLRRTLQGDLDNIVMMALRKEPERRYASAEQMAEDIGRYLNEEVVLARKDTLGYRVSKFIRRHRGGVTTAVVLLLLVVGAATAYTISIRAERDRAEAAQADAEQTVAFLEGFLGAADPFETERRDTLRVGDLLRRAASSVEHDLAGQPLRQGRLYLVLGRAFEGLGRYVEADSVLRLALARFEEDPPRWSEAAEALGNVLAVAGDEAAYAEAEHLLREVLAERLNRLGADHPDVAGTRNALAFALSRQGALEEAEAEYRRALAYHRRAVPVDSGELAFITKNLADVLEDRGALGEAEALLRESVALRRAHFGGGHPSLATGLQSLAALLRNSQRPDAEAEASAREAVAINAVALGPDHPHTLNAQTLLGSILRGQGRLAEAAEILEDVVLRAERASAGPHPGYPVYLDHYARVLIMQERYDDAEAVARRALALSRKMHGEIHAGTGGALSRLASIARGRGDHAQAVRYHREAITSYDAYFDAPNLFSAFERAGLAKSLAALKRYDEAETTLLESLDMLEAIYDGRHEQVRKARQRLIDLYEQGGRLEEAARWRARLDE
jgi:serine/threonine protein kinase